MVKVPKVKGQGHQGQKTEFFGPFGGLLVVDEDVPQAAQ